MDTEQLAHQNWHPSKDIFLAEITAVAAPVTDASGTFVAHGWKEKEAYANARGFRDKFAGRTGSVTLNPGFSPEGDSFSVGDLVYMRHRGWTNVSGVGDTTYEIIGAAGVNPSDCCPGYLGDDGHECCDILGGPPPCCCDCGGGGGGGGSADICVVQCTPPTGSRALIVSQAMSPVAYAWFRANPQHITQCYGTTSYYHVVIGNQHPSLFQWAVLDPDFGYRCPGASDSATSGGGGATVGGGPRPSPCSTSPSGHFLEDGTWIPPCPGGTITPSSSTGPPRSASFGAGFLGAFLFGGGLFDVESVVVPASSTLGTLTPTALSADQNNYNPGQAGILRLATDAGGDRTITGLGIGQTDGQRMVIYNIGAVDNILLAIASGSSSAANRWANGTAVGNITVAPGTKREFVYTNSLWEMLY